MGVRRAAEMVFEAPERTDTAPGTRRKEWLLADHESGCSVRLIVEGAESEGSGPGHATLRCFLECETDSAPQLDQVRIEIRRAQNNSLFLAGPLSNFQADPIVLTLEAWTIKLIPGGDPLISFWEIPLQLEPGEEAESTEP